MFLKRLPPAVVLLFLAPIFGELVSGHQTPLEFINPLSFLITALPYGFGAIICRELKIRWGKGWLSLVLLGIAFGIYEEAIVARSFFDPAWAELGALREYSFWQGVTWLWAEVLIHFHLTISILSSVVLTEIIYFNRRNERWVGHWGLAACFIGLGLWFPVLMVLNPFMPPLVAFTLSWVAIAGLVYAAWRIPAQVFRAQKAVFMPPIGYGVVTAINMSLVFTAVFILPEHNPVWLPAWPVMFVFIALLDVLTFLIIMRWSGNGASWDDRHKLAIVIGFLTFFIVFGGLRDVLSSFSGLSIVGIITAWGLWRVWTCTQTRYSAALERAG